MSNEITISHGELGTIVASPNCSLSKKKKNMIKGLAFLQLICMTPDAEEDNNFDEFMDIVGEAASKVRELYSEEQENESISVSQF